MKKIALLTVLTLMMSITALGGCAEGTDNGMNANTTEVIQQSALSENTERTIDGNVTLDENVNEDTEGDKTPEDNDCDDNHCKDNENDGENDENEMPEHRHRLPRKGHRHGHGRRPHPRPMPKKFR